MPSIQLNRRQLIGASLALAAVPGSALAEDVVPRITRLAPGLDRVLDPAQPIETIASGIQWAEGPVWVPQDGGYLLFSDPPANVMRRWSRKGGVSEFLRPSGLPNPDPKLIREAGSNGLSLDREGRLIVADSGSRALVRVDLATKTRTVLADRYKGKRLNSVNDMHVARSGAIYFTDPPYGLAGLNESAIKELPFNGVYRWTPDGEVTLLDGALSFPNGIALSPDEKQLFVAISDPKGFVVMVYDLDAKGLPRRSRTWFDASGLAKPGVRGSCDGMKIAADGTHFNSVPGGMMILTPDAEPLGLIHTGWPIANCAFGEDGRTLFCTANDRVLRLRLKIDGWA
jgi:gluconolactonase